MMDRIVREHARLIVLRVLAKEPDGALNSAALQDYLQLYGISKPRDWLHDELRWLADMGAVTVTDPGSASGAGLSTVRIAAITRKGLDHVERRLCIEGIKRPSPAEG